MVVFGGLELVAAGYLIHQHEQQKKEKQRLKEEARRRNRRRHSTSPPRERRYRQEERRKSGPRSSEQSSFSTAAPSRSTARLPSPGTSHSSATYLPSPAPAAVQRPNSQRPQGYRPPARHTASPPLRFASPSPPPPSSQAPEFYRQPFQPPSSVMFTPSAPPSVSRPTSEQRPPHLAEERYSYEPEADDSRRRSDSTLPLGLYERPDAVYELAADGPWMHDQHLTAHQRPHVRFNLPNYGVVSPTDPKGPPPPPYRP